MENIAIGFYPNRKFTETIYTNRLGGESYLEDALIVLKEHKFIEDLSKYFSPIIIFSKFSSPKNSMEIFSSLICRFIIFKSFKTLINSIFSIEGVPYKLIPMNFRSSTKKLKYFELIIFPEYKNKKC